MKNNLVLISVLFLAALLMFGCTSSPPTALQNNAPVVQPQSLPAGSNAPAPPNVNAAAGATPQSNASAQTGAKPPSLVGTSFSAWKYYPMAHAIAPGPISADAQTALNVFTVAQAPGANGSILVTVTDHADASVNNFTVSKGETLYFSDGFAGDDTGNETDSTLVDDHFVLVDGHNTIVQALSTP